jgi:predicted nucleotidyltransferase
MQESIRNNRAAIRRLVASAGASNPRLKESDKNQTLEILVDLRPGVRSADIQRLQIDLEEILRVPIDVSTPASLTARDRAATLQKSLPI